MGGSLCGVLLGQDDRLSGGRGRGIASPRGEPSSPVALLSALHSHPFAVISRIGPLFRSWPSIIFNQMCHTCMRCIRNPGSGQGTLFTLLQSTETAQPSMHNRFLMLSLGARMHAHERRGTLPKNGDQHASASPPGVRPSGSVHSVGPCRS